MGPEKRPAVILEARVVAGSGGGPDKTILNSPRFLWSAGYRTLCAYMHPPHDPGFDELRRKAEQWQAPLFSISDRGPLDWRVVTRLLNLCRRERVAIWHGHDYKSNALGLLLRRFWPMTLVTTVHGWVHQTTRTPFYYWVDRLCLARYERVICVSPDLVDQCLSSGVPRERCLLVENAIDTSEFRRQRDTASAKGSLGVPAGRLVIGTVGRLSAEKGFDLLVHAVDQLIRDGVDIALLIAGDGVERPALQRLIEELGREDRIRLLGYQSDIRPLYEAMDVYALSSLREGLPNVLLEAMAFEVPVLATRVAGVPRLVLNGENGLVVEPGSARPLIEGLRQLVADVELRRRFGQAGRQTVLAAYSFAVRMAKIRSIYDELLGRTSPSVAGRSRRLP